MRLRKIVLVLVVTSCSSSAVAAQRIVPHEIRHEAAIATPAAIGHAENFSEVVVPITAVRITPSIKAGISGKVGPALDVNAAFGTGFCLDGACSLIVSNYHVAVTTQAKKIEEGKITGRYFATGPRDEGATANFIRNFGPMAFATKRDLAIFKLEHPLRHHHGLAFSVEELKVGQEVDIYGYPKGIISPFRKLTRFPAVFQGTTASDLLAFDYDLPTDKAPRIAGASGGIVVDRQTEKILGILCGTTETTAVAVPVETLVAFVTRVQPFLAQQIFPAAKQISPVAADIYPKFVPPHSEKLQHRVDEALEIATLRQKAQLLAESIRNFIAVQSYAWGSGDQESDMEAAYEVRVADGAQTFRDYPDGKEESKEPRLPRRKAWVLPGNEWSELPKMVGTEFKLKIHQAAEIVLNHQRLKIFQYYAGVEDDVCQFEAVADFGFFTRGKRASVECYGEVWTDEHLNIVRISKRLDLSNRLKAYRGWQGCDVILTYGWLNRANEDSQLVPLTIYTEARDKKHTYWCRGSFTDYRVFSVGARLVLE